MTNHIRKTPLLEIRDFCLEYRSASASFPVLRELNISLGRREILGIIGESGAGKSTVGNAVLGLLAPGFRQTAGTILLDGEPIDQSPMPAGVRGCRIAAIFQDHTASLDPLMKVGQQIEETVLALDSSMPRRHAKVRVLDLMSRVGIPDAASRYRHYPHQFSGGQRQRLVIAIALAGSPDIIIADEPTSALDATVQKQILALLRSLVDDTDLSIILVTHDMGVVADITDRVIVMRKGEIVEQARTAALLDGPQHPYSRGLLAAVPRLRTVGDASRSAVSAVSDRRAPSPFFVARNIGKSFMSEIRPPWWPHAKRAGKKGFALQDVNIVLEKGSVTGIVGESGSGKTTVGRIIAGLETAQHGWIDLEGCRYDPSKNGRRNGLLGQVQMIFQDPSASLNPRMTIAETLLESIRFAAQSDSQPLDLGVMLDRLGLARTLLGRKPHQLSGGQKQRVCIARALLAQPQIIVADEPTSALDVSVQAEIITLLKDVIGQNQTTLVFISHDLAVVQELCEQIYIFKDGRIEDQGSSDFVFSRSTNPYTQALIEARSSRFRL